LYCTSFYDCLSGLVTHPGSWYPCISFWFSIPLKNIYQSLIMHQIPW
jgi:hypothetical protein